MPASLVHLTPRALIHLLHQAGDGHCDAGVLLIVIPPVHQLHGQIQLGLPIRDEGAGRRIVEPLGRRKGHLFKLLEGFRLGQHLFQGRQLGPLKTQTHHARTHRCPTPVGRLLEARLAGNHAIPVARRAAVVDRRLLSLANRQDGVVVGEIARLTGYHVAAHQTAEGVLLAAEFAHEVQCFDALVLDGLGPVKGIQHQQGDHPVDRNHQQQGRGEDQG